MDCGGHDYACSNLSRSVNISYFCVSTMTAACYKSCRMSQTVIKLCKSTDTGEHGRGAWTEWFLLYLETPNQLHIASNRLRYFCQFCTVKDLWRRRSRYSSWHYLQVSLEKGRKFSPCMRSIWLRSEAGNVQRFLLLLRRPKLVWKTSKGLVPTA